MKGLLRQMPNLGVGRIVPATAASELSVFTQRGAYPGLPVLSSSVSSMFLKVSGTIPEDEDPFTIETLRGGMVGIEEAQWIYSQLIDSELRPVINTGAGKGSIDTVRGWEWPSYVSHYEALVLGNDPDLEQLDAATTSDGRIWQAYRLFDTGVSCSVIVTVRDPIDGTWTDVTVYENTDTTRTLFLPCLVVLPDDRVIVYLLNYGPGGTTFQLQARVIEPVNLDVTDYEVACLKTTLPIATYGTPDFTSQLRGACKPDGSVVLVMSTELSSAYRILQLGSYDYGHSFEVVSYGAGGSEEDTLPDVVYTQGVFVVSYVQAIDGGEGIAVLIAVKVLSNYFDSLDDAPVLATFSELADAITERHVLGNALIATPDGILYNVNTVTNDDQDTVFGHMHVSLDLGATWETHDGDDKPNVGYDPNTPGVSWLNFNTSDANETAARPRYIAATCQGNRVYVGAIFLNDSQTANTNDDGSLVAFYLGGWSNQQKAFIDSLQKTADGQISYKDTFFAFVDPEFNGWTKTSAGSNGAAISGSRRVITTADGGKLYYSMGGGTSVSTCSLEFDFVAGATFGTMSHGDVGVEILIDNGTLKYRLGLYFLATSGTQGGIRLRDLVAGTTIADIPLDWSTTEYTFRIELYNSKFQLWYRPTSSIEDQIWERAIDPFSGTTYAGYTLSNTASTGAAASVAWGHFFATTTGSTGDAVTRWRRVLTSFGTELATSAAASGIKYWFISDYVDYSETDDFHNGYPFVAAPVWVRDGVYVTASGGPTYLGDEWEIRPAYQYPIENILPEGAPAPGKVWESTTDDEEAVIYWLVGRGDVEAELADVLTEFPRNESLGLWIANANFPTAALYGVNSSDVEVKILDINLVRFTGLTFSNHGDTLQILSGGGTTYVAPGELVGGHVLNSGETTPKLITDNTDGQTNDDTKRTTITFESSGTETQGVDNDAGNKIFVPSGFFVCHSPPANQFKAYVLRIPAQETALGRFRCKVMFGPLTVFGIAPAFGFSTTLPQDNVLRNKTNAGHTETRVYNGLPRVKALSWEALDQTRLDDVDPDYIQFAAGDEPAALYDDAARQLSGLMKQLEGANELVVYCDKIPATTNTGELCPERFVYGRATSEFQESNRVGNEGRDEVVQVTNFVIEEEM
jgi:hypothetical protein